MKDGDVGGVQFMSYIITHHYTSLHIITHIIIPPPSTHTPHSNQYVPLPAHDLEQAAAAALENEPGCLHERYQEEAESRLNDLYNSLAKCKDMAEQVCGVWDEDGECGVGQDGGCVGCIWCVYCVCVE